MNYGGYPFRPMQYGFAEAPVPDGVIGGFAFDNVTVPQGERQKMLALARRLLASGTRSVRLVGHTDPVGSPQYNKGLGQRRAEVVRQALIAALDGERPGSGKSVAMAVDSAGATQPVGGGRPAQRRVEVFFAPPPPPPPPPPRKRDPDWVEQKLREKREEFERNPPPPGPSMGPVTPGVRYPREECPAADICVKTQEHLRELQRKKQFLSQDDANRALDMELELLKQHRPRLVRDPRGPAWAKWVMERRMEAYQRLKRFASQVQWMPPPRL